MKFSRIIMWFITTLISAGYAYQIYLLSKELSIIGVLLCGGMCGMLYALGLAICWQLENEKR